MGRRKKKEKENENKSQRGRGEMKMREEIMKRKMGGGNEKFKQEGGN
jgi:hypothetical protein